MYKNTELKKCQIYLLDTVFVVMHFYTTTVVVNWIISMWLKCRPSALIKGIYFAPLKIMDFFIQVPIFKGSKWHSVSSSAAIAHA